MTSRFSRLALLTSRIVRTTKPVSRIPLVTASTCQLRKISSTAIVREQYLHGYKDTERYHGKVFTEYAQHCRLKDTKQVNIQAELTTVANYVLPTKEKKSYYAAGRNPPGTNHNVN